MGRTATRRRVLTRTRSLTRKRGRTRSLVGGWMPNVLQMCCKQWAGVCCAQATELTEAQHTAGRGRTRPHHAELTALLDGGTIREH